MEFLGFTLSVWSAIILGVFFLLMVVACTEDRRGREAMKWLTLFGGIAVLGVWFWGDWSWTSIKAVATSADMWKSVGIYLGIGLAYCLVEFTFQVRREAKKWRSRWEQFSRNYDNGPQTANQFVSRYQGTSLVDVRVDENDQVVPQVNRGELIEGIGCWTIFWPAYAVSLVLGDAMRMLTDRFARLIEYVSHGYVKRAFAKVFTS